MAVDNDLRLMLAGMQGVGPPTHPHGQSVHALQPTQPLGFHSQG